MRRHVLVSGRVQGVWFRQSAAECARALRVHGRVRNLADGRVELEAEGAPDDVDGLVVWCHGGPPRARVDAVVVTDIEPTGEKGFRVS